MRCIIILDTETTGAGELEFDFWGYFTNGDEWLCSQYESGEVIEDVEPPHENDSMLVALKQRLPI